MPHDAQDAYRQAATWKNWIYIYRGASDFMVNYKTPSAYYIVGYTITSTTPVIINGKAYAGKATVTNLSFFDKNITLKDGAEVKFYDVGKNYAVTAINFVNPENTSLEPNTSITLGANIETIGERTFADLTNLTEIKLSPNLKYIGNYAFQNSGIANDINLPYGLKICGSGVFRNTKVKHILVPGSVTTLGLDAFAENKNLEELILNKSSWSNLADWDITGIPTSCKLYVPVGSENLYKKNPKLGKLKVTEGSYDFTFNNANAHDTHYHMTVTSDNPVTVDGVTYAGEAKYVYHPANMQLTSYNRFTADNYETDVTNGANKKYLMTKIDDSTLDMCSHVTEVNIDKMKHLRHIGRRAFFYTGIQKFTVPSTCVYIGEMAFASCQKLSELMLLNNEKVYTTSEKSARYTKMQSSGIQLDLFLKWQEIIKDLIAKKYGNQPYFSEKRIEKLAQENARYFLSIYTPTSFAYTVSYRQLNYIYAWLKNLNKTNSELIYNLKPVADEFCSLLENNNLIDDDLAQYALGRQFSLIAPKEREEYFGDVYSTNYQGSFASLAQAQRHRSLNYEMKELNIKSYYIPKILESKDLQEMWIEDMLKVEDVTPQGQLVQIYERGTPENFILKVLNIFEIYNKKII